MESLDTVVVLVPTMSSLTLLPLLVVVLPRKVGGIGIIVIIIVVRFRFRFVIVVISALPFDLTRESPIARPPHFLLLFLPLPPLPLLP